jgi:hypothetical protein
VLLGTTGGTVSHARTHQVPSARIDPSTGRQHAFTTTGVHVWLAPDTPPDLCSALCSGRLADTVCAALGTPHVEFLSVKPVVKTSAISHPSPWHQDYK